LQHSFTQLAELTEGLNQQTHLVQWSQKKD